MHEDIINESYNGKELNGRSVL